MRPGDARWQLRLPCGRQRLRTATPLVIITLDTLRADHLGLYGYDRPTSPALDTFAQTATVFHDAICGLPTTLPSHLTLFTGLTPTQHGVTSNGMVPTHELTSVFELLEAREFRSEAVIAARVLDDRFIAPLGLDHTQFGDGSDLSVNQITADRVTDSALRRLAELGDERFALWLHYFDPHEPYAPPPRIADRFTAGYRGGLGNRLTTEWLVGLNRRTEEDPLPARDRQHVVDLYDAEIAHLDQQLGRLFAELERLGLWDQALIVIVGDHGQALGDPAPAGSPHGFWGHGERLVQPVLRVPLMIKLPQQTVRHDVETPVETLDLAPTLLELYSLESPPQLTGRSLVPALEGGALSPPIHRVAERRTYTSEPERRGLALLRDDWKLTIYRSSEGDRIHLGRRSGAGGLDGENFLTAAAPELDVLAGILAETWSDDPAAVRPPHLSSETIEMLGSLGYVP